MSSAASPIQATSPRFGPLFVALGAFLWATDSIFRAQVVDRYPASVIVFLNHALALIVALPIVWRCRRRLASWRPRQWAALAVLTLGGSVTAGLLFTAAFANTTNYTVPILIQKLQPLVAIGFATTVLGERPTRNFWLWAALALAGAYLVSFGAGDPRDIARGAAFVPVLLALGAAAIWGACTIAGRDLLLRESYWLVTATRFAGASLVLGLLLIGSGDVALLAPAILEDFTSFAMMAFGPGMLALLIYYYGLKSTTASVATLCELAFPLGAIVVNWWLLESALEPTQLVGAAALIAAVTASSLPSGQPG